MNRVLEDLEPRVSGLGLGLGIAMLGGSWSLI